MKVSEIMQKNFLCLDADDTLQSAAKKMADRGLDEAPVTRQEKFIGTFSSSDIAAALVKKNIMGGVKPADALRVSHELVCKHLSHRPIYLDEDADIISAVAFIMHRNDDIIPVLSKKNALVGVVLTSRLQKEMAKMLSVGAAPKSEKAGEEGGGEAAVRARGGTEIDRILSYVQKRGSVSSEEVARQFKIPLVEVEEYAASLEKHGLLRMDYNLIGKMKLVSAVGQGKE